MPNGTEIDSANASSFGFQFEVLAANSDGVTDGLMTSTFSLAGTHINIRLPTTSPAGIYQLKTTVNGTYKVVIDPLAIGFGSVKVRVTSP